MPASTPGLGMFHRRVALVVALVGVSMVPLTLQLGRLTLARGAELRSEAEAALVAREWKSTRRGTIVDRHGRVLAKDRPSFDVTVDYEIIAGGQAWARARAGRIARQVHRQDWPELTAEQRGAIIDLYMPPLLEHLESMWRVLSEQTGVPLEQIERRRQEIRRDVERRFSSVYRSRLTQEIDAQLALGREMTTEVEDEVRRRAGRQIEEQRSPHVIIARVADATAFELQRLADQRTQVAVDDGSGGFIGVDVAMLPGVGVESSGDREYPLDRVMVQVDTRTLPTPARGPGMTSIPVDGVAFHILGRMRGKATQEDAQRRAQRLAEDAAFAQRVRTPPGAAGLSEPVDRGEYQEGDVAGLGGIEEAQEDELRGLRGLVVEQRETGERQELPAEPGRDIRLTIDTMLQARVQAAMTPELGLAVAQTWHSPIGQENPTVPVGTPLRGAAVVLDVDSGEILAMVSTPTISREALREDASRVFEDPFNRAVDVPWVDRAIARPYPPGSIAKALILTGAVTLGKHDLSAPISCTGHLFPDKPDMFRCWIFKQFGLTHDGYFGHAPNAEESMMVSCNTYFFTLGQRLGPEGAARVYQMFGLGDRLDIGLERRGQDFVEFPGYLGLTGSGAPASATEPGRISPSDAIQMGIGQGPVAWTPLHAADAYATLARGGVRMPPTLIAGRGSREAQNLGLDPRSVKEALEGLRLAVNDERGTGHHLTLADTTKEPHFNVPGVEIWGKTGTATAPTLYLPQDAKPGDELWRRSVDPVAVGLQSEDEATRFWRRILRTGDHSWFVVLVGRQGEHRPRFSISVMMEYAGSGGKVSGPIANQIIHALVAEGYL